MPVELVGTGDSTTTGFTPPSGTAYLNQQLYVGGLLMPPTTYTYDSTATPPIQFNSTAGFLGSTTPAAPGSGDPIIIIGDTKTSAAPGTGTSTLATVRATIRQRADLVNSLFVTDAELNGWINSSYFELYDLLVEAYGDDYFTAQPSDPYVITTDGTSDFYALPNGTSTYLTPKGATAAAFYKLLAADMQLSGSWYPMKRFDVANRARGGELRYRLQGNFLWLAPLPPSGQKVRLRYIPRLAPLALDSDVIDGVSGWEEYVVADCLIKVKTKEESDVSVELGLKAALKLRIEAIKENRDAGEPQTVNDVRGGAFDDGCWWNF